MKAGDEPKLDGPKPGTGDKEEYDMTEVAPVITHHQITVDGKLLKYTATPAGCRSNAVTARLKPRCFSSPIRLMGKRREAPADVRLQWRPGISFDLAAHGRARSEAGGAESEGFLPPRPYRVEDNPYTLLDKSDLVLRGRHWHGFQPGRRLPKSQEIIGA